MGGNHRGVDSGGTAADNGNLFYFFGGSHFAAVVNIFLTGAGIHRALGMPAFDEFIDTSFLIADAGTNPFHLSRVNLIRPLRIGQKRPRQHNHVALFIAQRLFGKVGITEFAHRHYRHFHAGVGKNLVFREIILDDFRYFQKTARRHESRRMRQPPVVVTTEIDVKHIHARADERSHIIKRLFGRALVFEFAQGFNLVHFFPVRFVERQ